MIDFFCLFVLFSLYFRVHFQIDFFDCDNKIDDKQHKATLKTIEPDQAKHAKLSAPKSSDLPEIEDYERPELEKFEKPEFEKTEKPKKVRFSHSAIYAFNKTGFKHSR